MTDLPLTRSVPLRRVLAMVTALALGIVLPACSWQSQSNVAGAIKQPIPPVAPPPMQAVAPPTPDPPPPPSNWIASAMVPKVAVYADPSVAQPVRTLSHPTPERYPLAFRVQERAGDWLKVFLPVRPNGSVGWIRASDVALSSTNYRMVVEVGAHRITLYDGANAVLTAPVGVGVARYPTPPGDFYIDATVPLANADGVYGPYQLSIAGFSDVLTSFGGGQGQLALHGTNSPAGIGTEMSHGCVRMLNDVITTLAQTVPVGTPVQIVA